MMTIFDKKEYLNMKLKRNAILQMILWIVQGAFVGIGAILPGISGGTLCYAFGIYNQLLEVLSNPIKGIKKHWFMLTFVVIGIVLGFVGFSGVTYWLLSLNEGIVLSVFVGLIFGTIPDIWKEAGERGRNKFSIISLVSAALIIGAVFYIFKNVWVVTIQPGFFAWLLCGLLWGLGFVVPGLSSSTLIMFFGLYDEMSAGISRLDFAVLIPLGIAILVTFLLLSKVMKLIFNKFYSVVSHCVLGFVVATTVMILPFNEFTSVKNVVVFAVSILGGAVASFFFTKLCDRIKAATEAAETQKEENNS